MERLGLVHAVRSAGSVKPARDSGSAYLIHLSMRLFGMDKGPRDLRDIDDKLDSLHRRVDKFYEWAALLQKEFRDMQQRQRFLESYCPMEFTPDNLKERLERIKAGTK